MIIKMELDYAKEVGEVMDLVVAVVKHFKEGKEVSELANVMGELMAAISGMDEIDDELKESKIAVINAVYFGAADLVDALVLKKADETAS